MESLETIGERIYRFNIHLDGGHGTHDDALALAERAIAFGARIFIDHRPRHARRNSFIGTFPFAGATSDARVRDRDGHKA